MLTSYIIGNGSLVVKCAEYLLAQSVTIKGIVTDDKNVTAWAVPAGIKIYADLAELTGQAQAVDYIFSIANYHILKAPVLKLAKKLTINYHDALLPRYAGVNATVWALSNNEKEHGISWHIVEEGIDTGNLLEQRTVSIEPSETALSLNLKCYAQAIEAFESLVQKLISNHLIQTPQLQEQRSYYGINHPFPGEGVINWHWEGETIARYFRALSVGAIYENNVTLLKVQLGNQLFAIQSLNLVPGDTVQAAGSILSVDVRGLVVATGSTAYIHLQSLSSLDGITQDNQILIKKLKLIPGKVLNSLDEAKLKQLQQANRLLLKQERRWIKCLEKLKPLSFLSDKLNTSLGKEKPFQRTCLLNQTLLTHVASSLSADCNLPKDLLAISLVLLLVYLSRLNQDKHYSLGVSNSALCKTYADLAAWVELAPKLTIKLSSTLSLKEACYQLIKDLKAHEKHHTYLKEISIRYPQLKGLDFSSPVFPKNAAYSIHLSQYVQIAVILEESGIALTLYTDEEQCQEMPVLTELLANFKYFVSQIDSPNQVLSSLPLLSHSQRQQVLINWNQTQADYPEGKTLQQLFEAQVEKTPDKLAVVYEGQQLTYQQLNEKANQLAHYLREQHPIVPDTLIAISLERSLELVIGILAVLKAGGAYVPLDPGYPQERLSYMLEDTKAPLLLTQQSIRERYASYGGTQLCLDEPTFQERLAVYGQTHPHAQTNPESGVQSQHLAYVIYTSGSTGKPKGVLVEHRGIVNLVFTQAAKLGFNEAARVGLITPIGFDVSVKEWANSLLTGATLCIPKEQQLLGNALEAFIAKQSVSLVAMTPSRLSTIKPIAPLKTVMIGGESAGADLIQAWCQAVCLLNAYGPTETTICACFQRYADLGHENVIGKPIANTVFYVLDAYQQPVPVGMPGELYIGGAGVARGYLSRPELTAEKFVANPFVSPEDNAQGKNLRLYRTGDLVRYRADGNIEFLGRIDHQVKLRGYRIELGEVESQLKQVQDEQGSALLKEVVVIAREDTPGDKRLVAYLVPTGGLPDEVQEQELLAALRAQLSQILPEYMMPQAFVCLEKLPLNANGKLDRKILPKPQVQINKGTAPQTVAEQRLAVIWAKLLERPVESLKREDNFFSLGGHSLLATRLRSLLARELQSHLSLQTLFQHPSLEGMAQAVSESRQVVLRITPQERPARIPLSYAQQRLWFLQELLPNKAAYNMPTVLRLSGKVNVSALMKAYEAVIGRHEGLRTVFKSKEGQAYQVILPTITGMGYRRAENEAVALDWIQLDANTGFDLSEGPLIRSQLIELSGGETTSEYLLLINLHHSVGDGWSMNLLFNELSVYYQAYCEGKEASLPALPIQCADYAIWQREYLKGEVLTQQLSYWQSQLQDAPESLNLPFDKPRPALPQNTGTCYQTILDKETAKQLKDLSRQQGATLFMVVLALFQSLLYRYSQQENILIGTPIAGRHHKETEGLIGMFVNTLALRARLTPQDSFISLLKQIKQTTIAAYEHQDIPFEQLVDHLKIERQLNRNPLFQVMLVVNEDKQDTLNFKDIQINDVNALDYTVAKFDLTLQVQTLSTGELALGFEYSTELFERNTIERMAEHFKVLTQSLVQAPQTPLAKAILLTQEETKQLLIDWNQTQAQYPKDKTIHQLFEAQVQQTPDNIALVFEDKQLTYKELNQKANQLAHYLKSQHVIHPDTLIAISLERSLELVIGILAILKAGGAYVPLDPTHPKERLAYMLDDTKAPVLITQQSARALYEAYAGKLVCLDEALTQQAIAGYAEAYSDVKKNINALTQPKHLAYVIYTSGSTGKPKGVMVEHEGVVNLANDAKTSIDKVIESDRILQTVTFNFDAAIYDWSRCFLNGATLYMNRYALGGDELVDYINQNQITHAVFPAGMLRTLSPGSMPSLKSMITMGDKCPKEIMDKWAKYVTLINGYGPTETVVATTTAKYQEGNLSSVIGRPLTNKTLYILDSHLQPVPIGIPGELYIGGVGVARGYLNQPELTAERFIANPFGDGRLYKTGDLVRYLSDGNIEFLGRIDQQVKIRGFRVELGEIESQLRQVKDEQQEALLKDVAVIVREDNPGDKRLAAYLVSRLESAEAEGQLIEVLREALSRYLPDYMIPGYFMFLDKLPLNANGKLDRKALPKPNTMYSQEKKAAPRNVIEQQLAQVWSEVLKVDLDSISIFDNFFNLGGHSLLLVELISKINGTLKENNQPKNERIPEALKLSVLDVFKYPTLAELAKVIVKPAASQETIESLLPIQLGGNKEPVFFIHPGEGLALLYLRLKGVLLDRPLYGINNPYHGKKGSFNSIEEMASHYLTIIRKVQPQGPYYLAGWSLGGYIALEMAQQLTQNEETVEHLIIIDSPDQTHLPKIDKIESKEEHKTILSEDIKDYITLFGAQAENMVDRSVNELMQAKELIDKYRAKTYIGQVTLLRAQVVVPLVGVVPEIAEPYSKIAQDIFAGWLGKFNTLKVISVTGEHDRMFDYENIESTKVALTEALTQPHLVNGGNLIETNLLAAAKRNDSFVVKKIVSQHKVSINLCCLKDNWTLLHWAAYYGNTELVNNLLKQGASKLLVDKQGRTPADIASLHGHVGIAYQLSPTYTKDSVLVAKQLRVENRVSPELLVNQVKVPMEEDNEAKQEGCVAKTFASKF